jgi:4-hydroxy-tetrahydrodipicolinate reductase
MIKIALLGYGKMGKEIDTLTVKGKHEITHRVTSRDASFLSATDLSKADVAIEFSTPTSVLSNIRLCFEAGIPVVIGTTGWYEHLEEISAECKSRNQSMIWASNFSIGVNIFFELNRCLAGLMNARNEYQARIEEIHHIHKLDAPSGTAISLAKDSVSLMERYSEWMAMSSTEHTPVPGILPVYSERANNVPGTHQVTFHSPVDTIVIRHEAYNRKGFAAGALMAAEWVIGKKGCFTMKDVLNNSI